MRNRVLFIVTIGLLSALLLAFTYNGYWWVVGIFGLLLALTIHDIVQKRHSLLANFPLVGRMRWIIEELRPFVQQYLLETETSGRPISRMFRSIVYQRAKNSLDTVPFGTQINTYQSGYEWIGNSLSALSVDELD